MTLRAWALFYTAIALVIGAAWGVGYLTRGWG
jgi:hypothetical protein